MSRDPIRIVPVGLVVEDRLIVVVGAGRIAARKAAAYLDMGALIRIVAPEHSPEVDQLDQDRIERVTADYQPEHLEGAWMVVTATGIPDVDGAVFHDATERRMWCNAADDPDRCSAILPAVVREGPITVSISTGGTSPATASWMRRRTQSFLEDDLLSEAALAAHEVATRVRTEMRSSGKPTEIRGWQEAFDGFEQQLRTLLAEGQPIDAPHQGVPT